MNEQRKNPPLLIAFIPLAILIGMLGASIITFGSDSLGGGSQISLLAASAACVVIGIGFFQRKWKEYEESINQCIGETATAIIILLIIGALSGAWMISGVVPTLIYYGMQIIHPDFFLTTTCIICALVSLMTGSSWTTIATIGIALIGIGKAQGFNEGWIAGAIISGAYFGDKMSPLSDTTVLAASTTNTPLFSHIRFMMITTVPTLIITLIIFTIMGLTSETSQAEQITEISLALQERFHITPWLLIVPLLTGIMIVRRLPSLVTLFLSAVLACIFAIIFQADILHEVAGGGNLFRGTMLTLYASTSIESSNPLLTELIATRGMSGMMNTIWLILCAMCFGGSMRASGMIESITQLFVHFIKQRTSMVASTVASGIFLNATTADQYISIILTGNMFNKIYQKFGYESRLLSRSIEDGTTVTSPLIPWTTCGMTQATILSVPTIVYLPYCFFNIISPLMSIFIAYTGYKIFKIKEKA